jgi:hypothetical protein
MLRLIIFRFWPVFVPLLVYYLWMVVVRRKAVRAQKDLPKFSQGPWFWAVFASMVVMGVLFIVLGLTETEHKGKYTPAYLENGSVVPGEVK